MHEAFAAALDTWPQTGIPEKPRPWLISTARFKAIDAMRQRARFDAAQRDLALHLEARISEASQEGEEIEDDRLRRSITDWRQITALYDRLLRIQPSPAIAMCEEPEKGLGLIDDLLERGELANYHLAHSARAELCRRLGRIPEARTSYEGAVTGPAGARAPIFSWSSAGIEIKTALLSILPRADDYRVNDPAREFVTLAANKRRRAMKYICLGYIEPENSRA
jgi:predicted RNA polymerase sigma factor